MYKAAIILQASEETYYILPVENLVLTTVYQSMMSAPSVLIHPSNSAVSTPYRVKMDVTDCFLDMLLICLDYHRGKPAEDCSLTFIGFIEIFGEY